MNPEDSNDSSTDIAIVGFALRVPGADSAGQFWKNLSHGVESIRAFSAEDLAAVGVSKALLRDPDYIRAGAPLAHLDAFDAQFFGISPREAAIMDPQQRFFLESVWEALEHSGYAPGTFTGSTGVFAGSGPNSYFYHNLLPDADLVEKEGFFLLRHMGNEKDVLTTRVSYQMNLRGPSINIQTACSTSLVAVHVACQNLLSYSCDMAVAGAVSIEIPHAIGYHYRQNEIQSHDGHCRAFDAGATGTVFGNGLGIVVLRRLSDAIADGDTIHAVIKGSAVNNDGNRKVGFLAPSVEGQIAVITEALAMAGVEPSSIDYVETHGTGTPIGDPIELSALGQVFPERDRELKIGSVKTNIGHLDAASGMAGLIKTVLALKHRQIPATLHFKTLNPLIDTGKTKMQVVDKLTDWKAGKEPRRAGVTSLGIGGTNAHVILEEAPEPAPTKALRNVRLLTLSAKTPAALDDATRALAGHFRNNPETSLADTAYTLHMGRSEFAHRRMFVARDPAEALQLAELPNSDAVVTAKKSDPYSVAFLFSGQGSQYVNMGRELYGAEPVFRNWLDRCAEMARPHLGHDFRDILYPEPGTEAHADEQIRLTWNAQPILFAVEYALAQLWISWGVVPDKLIGHSLGEYPAACISGVFTLEDALSLVCARGNLMKKVAAGTMLAISQTEAEVTRWLNDDISLAAVNSPEQCVVSGPRDTIQALQAQLREEGIPAHRLETSHAFHSRSIDPVLETFTNLVRQKQLRAPQIPLVSNVTGTWLTEAEATDPAYWSRHFRQTVRFADGLNVLRAEPGNFLLEIGPGATLSSLSRQYGGRDAREKIFPSLPRSTEKAGDLTAMLTALGNLWVHGAAIDWTTFHAHEKLRRVPLPTYPFQRKKFWMGPKTGTNWLTDSLGQVDEWFYRSIWKSGPLTPTTPSAGPWLVLCDPSPDNQRLVEELRRQNANVITVQAGGTFEAMTEDSWQMNLASEGDYAQLLDHLIQKKQIPRRIVHLWGLAPFDAAEDRCFHSLVFLFRALGTRLPDEDITLIALSHRSVAIHGEAVLHPSGSLLAGPCRVAPLEYPHLRCRQIDVESTDPELLAPIILREGDMEDNADAPDSVAAYRNGSRWTQEVERFQLEPGLDRVRERGVYLITGGLGGLGMAVADWLARSHRARLILLSRHARTQEAIHEGRFAEWRKLGADVLTLTADVTDRASMEAALESAREKFGGIHGIIHAAGILQDGIIQLKKKETAHGVLAAKTLGVEILDGLTREMPLDFFVLFSSISALTPPDGQVDYCSANAFLGAFAQSRPADRHFIVIGWGPWAEIGMVAPKSAPLDEPAPFHHPLLERIDLDTTARTVYSGTLSVETHWVLSDHRFHGGDSLLPGTAHLEIAVTALWKRLGQQPVTLEDVVFLAPLRVASHSPVDVRAELEKIDDGYQFSVTSGDVVYVTGRGRATSERPGRINLREIAARCPYEKKDAPSNVRQHGHFDFGPRWQSLRQIAFGRDECLGTVEIPAEFRAETRDFALHPALMDIATGVAMYLISGYDKPGDMLLPFAYKKFTLYSPLPARVFSHTRLRHDSGADLVVFDITLAGENGEVIAEIEEFTVKRIRNVGDLSTSEAGSARIALPASDSSRLLKSIPTREGIEALQRILKSRHTEMVYVSPTPLSVAVPLRDNEITAASVTASADDVELVLTQLWQRLLGLETADLKTDFFDSGGHSLLAVRLFTEIRKRFNIDFGLSTLFEARTIGALADLIRTTREADPTEKATAGHALVPIRSGGASTPFFLIHDVGGGVLRYEHLARNLPGDQSIFAIESRGLSGLPVDYSVEDMARHYIEQIRERQPHGPYFVAGHSFGGLVTYEIARLLTAQGETMGLVGLLDTYVRPITAEDAAQTSLPQKPGKLPFFRRLAKDIRAQILGHDRIGYLMERKFYIQAWLVKTLYRFFYKTSRKLGTRMPGFLRDVKEANWIASDYYTPGAYDDSVVLFRCMDRIVTDPPDSSRVWKRLCKEVVILEVPGDHNSMLRDPGVKILAEQILSYLAPANSAPTEPGGTK